MIAVGLATAFCVVVILAIYDSNLVRIRTEDESKWETRAIIRTILIVVGIAELLFFLNQGSK
jgi:hypothetical protein